MQPLYVDFRDLGWEGWIIAPAGLDIGSCVGGCVREEYPPHSNYNLVVDAIGRWACQVLRVRGLDCALYSLCNMYNYKGIKEKD